MVSKYLHSIGSDVSCDWKLFGEEAQQARREMDSSVERCDDWLISRIDFRKWIIGGRHVSKNQHFVFPVDR